MIPQEVKDAVIRIHSLSGEQLERTSDDVKIQYIEDLALVAGFYISTHPEILETQPLKT